MKKPETPAQLQKIIGFYGWYQEWIPFYEVQISRWRDYLKKADKPTPEGDFTTITQLWTEEDADLLQELTEELIDSPCVLKRPDYNRRFYVKTDWSKNGSGMVILQADPNDPQT